MWWDEFKVQLNFAFTAYARSEGRNIHSENMKLCILTKKINDDFLSRTKVSILTHMMSVTMTMTYLQALATFRQAVNQKHLPGTNEVYVASTRRHEDVVDEDPTAVAATEDVMDAVVEVVTITGKILNIHKVTLSV